MRFMWKRLRRFLTVAEQPFLKHGNCEPVKVEISVNKMSLLEPLH